MEFRDRLGRLAFPALFAGLALSGCAPPQRSESSLPEGLWTAADGADFWIGTFPELGEGRFFYDFTSGRLGPVVLDTAGRYAVGAAIGDRTPGGPIPLASARRVDVTREEVEFPASGLTLGGTLYRMPSGGRRAAIVLGHGSGPLDRRWFDLWAHFFAQRGLVVLAYDKRGTGSSGGDWRQSTLEDLAADAHAAIEFLQSRPEVDGSRVGFWGPSQGGWVGARLASRVPDLAFLIFHAGPATTVAEQGLDSYEGELRAAGLSEADLVPIRALVELDFAYNREPSEPAWERLLAARSRAERDGVAWLPPLEPRDSWFRTFYGRILDFDPRPDLERLRCPLLAFFGEKDLLVPAAKNRERLAATLAAGGHPGAEIVTLPAANHLFLRAENGTSAEIPSLSVLTPRYFAKMADWLQEIGMVERQ
ncbi:MAG: alpha/beta fold hydrolase [Thermoanaerobaculia bacterium]|nr:alpha/beta fold hydrolase [Thermoanaerobaculia bacterium]